MEIIEIKQAEPTITLKLTATELRTIVKNYGLAPLSMVEESARKTDKKIFLGKKSSELYNKLHDLSREIDANN